MKSSKKNSDRTGNEPNTDHTEKHLHERLFDFHEDLYEQSYSGHEHRQGNQNVCIQHAYSSLSFTEAFAAICGPLLIIAHKSLKVSHLPTLKSFGSAPWPCSAVPCSCAKIFFGIFTIGADRSP